MAGRRKSRWRALVRWARGTGQKLLESSGLPAEAERPEKPEKRGSTAAEAVAGRESKRGARTSS